MGLTSCLLALALLAAAGPAAAQEAEPGPPPPVPVADDALTDALEARELTEAEYTLERARSVFQLARVRREFGGVARPAPRDATLILRDLAVRLDELAGADRALAGRLLARPPQGADSDLPGNGWAPGAPEAVWCLTVCLHWVAAAGDPDAPPSRDDVLPFGVPDWVQLSLQTWEDVWFHEVGLLGYRAPLSDASSPKQKNDPELDVYLEDIGSDGVFGYCTSDDPDARANVAAVSAFCVIDNDFLDFGAAHTPEEFLQVTTAHEFHHASQFAYDWFEDFWLMEGTAANIEETVYPEIDDNVGFLRRLSPLSRPTSPLDRAGFGDSEYGSWIFWRFLEEKVAGDPVILRQIWKRAAPVKTYALQAVQRVLNDRGHAFRDVFARFGTANRRGDYLDAEKAKYPRPSLTRTYKVGRQRPKLGWKRWRIDHLATRFFSIKPGRAVRAGANLRVWVRLPNNRTRASVIVVNANGSTVARPLSSNAKGVARGRTRFGRGAVKRVELVLSNASTRFGSCWLLSGPPSYSCFGRSLDDRRVFELRAKLVR